MTRSLFLFLLVTTPFCSTLAQDRNGLLLDGSSRRPYYALLYERAIASKASHAWTARLGFIAGGNAFGLPAGISWLKGEGRHRLELSAEGIFYVDKSRSFLSGDDVSDKYLFFIPAVGYRYQPPSGGLFFRLLAGPFISLDPRSDDFWKMDGKVYGVVKGTVGWRW